jgi:serine protease AprX
LNHPIIRVAPAPADYQPRPGARGGGPKELVPVTPELRLELSGILKKATNSLKPILREWKDMPAVVTLKLRPKALAKSHRPMTLLERAGMLPIGARQLGELLLPAKEVHLQTLDRIIRESTAKKIKANISTIDGLEAYTSDDVLGGQADNRQFRGHLAAWVQSGKPFLLEEFDFNDTQTSRTMQRHLDQLFSQFDITRLYPGLNDAQRRMLFVRCDRVEDILKLASFPGIRTLAMAPEFGMIDIVSQNMPDLGEASAANLPPPPPDADLPTVGVIDSGVAGDDILLRPWLDGMNTYVLPPETDYFHGTFVSAMIAGARSLNRDSDEFPNCSARVHSVAAMGTGLTGLGELLLRIQEAVAARPDIKVWNCSLGSPAPGDEHSFGYFAQQLDELADKHQILFVISAGNYQTVPLRPWPAPDGFAAGQDRISQPAESTRALTVGSIAHLANLVAPGEPSPFSRRGPGPAKIPKPEVVHRGGNTCDVGTCVDTGIRSIIPGGRLSEAVGTSFSTPIVSTIAANTWHGLRDRNVTRPETVKALVIHAAALNSPLRAPGDQHYYGFGVPDSPLDTLYSSPDTFTLVFEAELFDGIVWAKTPFPIPACMRPSPGFFRGEVIMTLAYSPPVDGRQGAEYVRANVNASFGTYDPDDDGELHHHGIVPLESPPAHDDLYEEAMIDHGFKWSPVKVYRKRFPRGVAAQTMRLKLELLRRAGDDIPDEPQRATVVLSLRGLEPDLPVYNDGLTALRQTNWVAASIAQQARIRI